MYQSVYTCSKTKSGARKDQIVCATEFAKQHQPPLVLHHTADDGNCLFDSLQQFGKHMNHAPLQKDPRNSNKSESTIMYLRRKLVEYAMNHIGELYDYFEQENGNSSPEEKILGLLEDGAWFSEMGDIAPEIIPGAFRVNMELYNIYRTDQKNSSRKFLPDRILLRYIEYDPSAPTIKLVRIYDGHYQWFSEAGVEPHPPIHAASAAASASSMGFNKFKNENQKLNSQNQLNSLVASMNKLKLSPKKSASTKKSVKSNKNTSMYMKQKVTRKKKQNTSDPRKQQYNHYQFLVNEIKQMNNNSTNKQNAIIAVMNDIMSNTTLSVNDKTQLINQFNA